MLLGGRQVRFALHKEDRTCLSLDLRTRLFAKKSFFQLGSQKCTFPFELTGVP